MKFVFFVSGFGLLIFDVYAKTEVVAQFLWHESQGGLNVISITDFNGETWSDPVQLYKTERPISSVSYGGDQIGNQLLVWTEQYKHKSLLMQKWFSSKSNNWNDASILSDHGIENIGATVLFDLQNRAWVFWAANGVGLSDIVSIRHEIDGVWSRPIQVNEINEVPDITPNASLNDSGNVVVTWFAYSFDQSDYIEVSKTISTESTSVYNPAKVLADKISPEDILPPDFAPDNSASLLYFPRNLMIQSRSILPTIECER